MKISTAIAAAAIAISGMTVTACGSDDPDEVFPARGWVSTVIAPTVSGPGIAEDCVHLTDDGLIQRGVAVAVLVGDRTVGSTVLGEGKFYSDAYTSGCKWQFSVPISQIADEYTVRVGESARGTATLEELRSGSFQYGAQVTEVQ